jgi:hypothetical protein
MSSPDAPTPAELPAHVLRDPRQKVAAHLRELAYEALDNTAVDLGLAARISDSLLSLIEAADDMDERAREEVRGAVDYFVLNRDETSDLDRHGLRDDADIVNRVADALDLPGLRVRI